MKNQKERWFDILKTHWQEQYDSDNENDQDINEIYCTEIKNYVIDQIIYALEQGANIYNLMMLRNNQFFNQSFKQRPIM